MIKKRGNKQCEFCANYVVVDIETTGLKAETSEIIEIGAIKVVNHEIVDRFNVLIKADQPLPPFITALTGIDDSLLNKEGKRKEEAFSEFLLFVNEDLIVGHNVNFDLGFLSYHLYETLGVYLSNPYSDTLYFSRRYLGKRVANHKLQTLTQYFGFSYQGAHRALADCHFTYQVYEALLELSLGYRS